MAFLADNSGFVSIDGTDVSGRCTEFSLEHLGDSVETTAGFGTVYRTRVSGLRDTNLELKIAYNTTNFPADALKMVPGVYTIVLGPEGSTSGNPKHEGTFVLESASDIKKSVEPEMTVISMSYKGAAAPSTNIFAGGVFA